MLLAIDIGNSNIVIGIMQGAAVLHSMRCATERNHTSDEYAFQLLNFCALAGVPPEDVEAAILSSVVPKLKRVFSEAVKKVFHLPLMIVEPGLKTGLNIKIDNPAELGSDLVVDAVAALHLCDPPLIVIDMGTATTFSLLDADGIYRGGLIIPGPVIAADALAANTSQLRRVDFSAPAGLIGRNTADCIRSGIIYGQAAMIDELISRFQETLGTEPTVLATGGIIDEILPYCRQKIRHEPHLLLIGLAAIHAKNSP